MISWSTSTTFTLGLMTARRVSIDSGCGAPQNNAVPLSSECVKLLELLKDEFADDGSTVRLEDLQGPRSVSLLLGG